MIIILEGCDRTGKTTLAEELKRLTGGTVIHASKPTSPPLEEYLSPLIDYRPGSGETIILDRWHWGEWVWPKIFKRESEMTWKLLKSIDKQLAAIGAMTVYCARHDYREWVKDLRANNEPISADQLFDALDLYEKIDWAMSTSTFWYDWTDEDDMETRASVFVENAQFIEDELVNEAQANT